MKLHLPAHLRSTLLACFTVFGVQNTTIGTVAFATGLTAYTLSSAQANSEMQFGGAICSTYKNIWDEEIRANKDIPVYYTSPGEEVLGGFMQSGQEIVVYNAWSHSCQGGAIGNSGICALTGNGDVAFNGNTASVPSSINANSWGGAIYNCHSFFADESFTLSSNKSVTFSGNKVSSANTSLGGAIVNYGGTFALSRNEVVNFSGNMSLGGYYGANGGAIHLAGGSFTLNGNGGVTFSGNRASGVDSASTYSRAAGGALHLNSGTFTMSGNEVVIFSENVASTSARYADAYGGAICLEGGYVGGDFTLSGNGTVLFSGNAASSADEACGGAIYVNVYSTFTLSGNEKVTFSGNTANNGGAICNYGTFMLSGNGDVLFEKNAEISNGSYRLHSISSYGYFNLSATEGKSVLFRDSVYVGREVSLNQDGTGDIIFSGATTEADLREVKGGVDGTAEEIRNSRTSLLAEKATLCGGRLIVEDGAILTGKGITVAEGANATIRLKDATLAETYYEIAVSAGSGLEFEGESTLRASTLSMADGSFLSFILGDAQTAVNWNANLEIQGGLTLNLAHEKDKPVQDSYALLTMQRSNTVTGWDAANLTISGTSAEHLVWENNTLYYRAMLVQDNGNTTLDTDVDTDAVGGTIGGKDDVNINGNGHTLSVKNEVQLVQMALTNGTVKLEGENCGIASVSLTEGGELMLTAGAGLTTGNIISMVANGSENLVINGDITLDDRGMKGKEGELATVSHADAKVLGDADISNVRVENSAIDLVEGCTVHFENVVLTSSARITDDPAIVLLDNVAAELVMGGNTSLSGSEELLAGTSLVQGGNPDVILTLTDNQSVLLLEVDTFDTVTLSGHSLFLELTDVPEALLSGSDYIGISFTSGTGYATFDSSLSVTLHLNGSYYANGYTLAGVDSPTVIYFSTPEPATATLSLLALAALAARRRRK